MVPYLNHYVLAFICINFVGKARARLQGRSFHCLHILVITVNIGVFSLCPLLLVLLIHPSKTFSTMQGLQGVYSLECLVTYALASNLCINK